MASSRARDPEGWVEVDNPSAYERAGCVVTRVTFADPDLARGDLTRTRRRLCVRRWEAELREELLPWAVPLGFTRKLFRYAQVSRAHRHALEATLELGGLAAAGDLVEDFWARAAGTTLPSCPKPRAP